MDVGYFIIAIMGCAEGAGASCTPVMTVPTRYTSEASCVAATSDALLANSNFDFPALLAECRPAARPASADEPAGKAPPVTSRV